MVLERVESDGQSTICGCNRIRVIPLWVMSMHAPISSTSKEGTYLQIHGDTIPEVHCKPERIITGVEGAAFIVELVTERQRLCFAVDILACLDVFRCVRINQSSSDALQEWNVGFETGRI